MAVTDRVQHFAELLRGSRRGRTPAELARELRCHPSTVFRVRREYEERYRARVLYDKRHGVYRLDPDGKVEIPGLWFRPQELAGLLGLAQWMESLGAGVLRGKLEPIRAQLEDMLRARKIPVRDWTERVRLLPMHLRATDPQLLIAAADAVLRRTRLELDYRGARDRAFRRRTLSPQTLVHYRDTWYLDAFDHGRRELRCFALHRARDFRPLPEAAVEIPREELDAHFAGPYGIFGGAAHGTAVLLFEGEAARIVNEERWHPQENRRILPDGRLRLEFPCGDVRELTRDVLRFADEVTVEGPAELREAVAGVIAKAMERNKQGGAPSPPSRGQGVSRPVIPALGPHG